MVKPKKPKRHIVKKVLELKKSNEPDTVSQLLGYVSRRNSHTAIEARKILEKKVRKKDTQLLIDYLNSPGKKPWYAIDTVIELLGKLRAKSAVLAISKYSHHKNTVVKLAVAQQLGFIRSKEAIPVLLEMVDDYYFTVLMFACDALIYIDDTSIMGCLEEKLSKFTSYRDKLYLSYTLYMLGDVDRLDYILKNMYIGSSKRLKYVREIASDILFSMAEVSDRELKEIMLSELKKAYGRESVDDVKIAMQHSIRGIERLLKEEEEEVCNDENTG